MRSHSSSCLGLKSGVVVVVLVAAVFAFCFPLNKNKNECQRQRARARPPRQRCIAPIGAIGGEDYLSIRLPPPKNIYDYRYYYHYYC